MGTLNEKDVAELSTLFYGLSGAEIEELITKSIRNAVIHNHPFDKRNIYEEYFVLQNILPQNCNDTRKLLQIKAKHLRNCNEKIFSLQVIADILRSSKTTIQKIVKEADIYE